MDKKGGVYHGTLLVDKPGGMTSHDAVQRVRRAIGERRIGHAGTLDPAARGLLTLCIGRATKIARFLTGCDKTYEAEVFLGISSKTYDAEGVDKNETPAEAPDSSVEQIDSALDAFRGAIKQRPPIYSAIHVNGERLYKAARAGRDVEVPEREVVIHKITVRAYDRPLLKLAVECGSGTYIRSLAHDIGALFGCGAYLSGLTRTRVGSLSLDDALTLDQIADLHRQDRLKERLAPVEAALDMGALLVTDAFRGQVIHGKSVALRHLAGVDGVFRRGDTVTLKDAQGAALAFGRALVDSSEAMTASDAELFEYMRVLN